MCKVVEIPLSLRYLVVSTAISPPLRIQSTPKKEYVNGCYIQIYEELNPLHQYSLQILKRVFLIWEYHNHIVQIVLPILKII